MKNGTLISFGPCVVETHAEGFIVERRIHNTPFRYWFDSLPAAREAAAKDGGDVVGHPLPVAPPDRLPRFCMRIEYEDKIGGSLYWPGSDNLEPVIRAEAAQIERWKMGLCSPCTGRLPRGHTFRAVIDDTVKNAVVWSGAWVTT